MPHQISLTSSSVGEMQELISRALGWAIEMRPSQRLDIKSSIVARTCHSIAAIRGEYSTGFRVSSPSRPGNIAFFLIRSGELGAHGLRRSGVFGKDYILVANVPDIETMCFEGYSDTTYFTVEKTVLARQAFLLDSIDYLPDIRGLVAIPGCGQVGQAITVKFNFLYHHMGMAVQGLISPYAERMLQDAVLAGLIDLLTTIGPSRPRRLAGSRLLVKRALDIIHACDAPLTVFDLAEQTGLSVRGLQYAFRKYLGMSPIDYMKQIRLDRARIDLQDGDPDSIRRAMRKWGFSNITRFKQEYVARFGEDAWPSPRRR